MVTHTQQFTSSFDPAYNNAVMKQQSVRHLQHERYHYHYGLLHRSELFLLELMMFFLVLVSLLTFAYSFFWQQPTASQLIAMQYADSFIALALLVEFGGRLLLSHHRAHFLRYNWWYLLAAIPLPLSVATLLRALRIFGFVKMLKIGIHFRLETDLKEKLAPGKR